MNAAQTAQQHTICAPQGMSEQYVQQCCRHTLQYSTAQARRRYCLQVHSCAYTMLICHQTICDAKHADYVETQTQVYAEHESNDSNQNQAVQQLLKPTKHVTRAYQESNLTLPAHHPCHGTVMLITHVTNPKVTVIASRQLQAALSLRTVPAAEQQHTSTTMIPQFKPNTTIPSHHRRATSTHVNCTRLIALGRCRAIVHRPCQCALAVSLYSYRNMPYH